MSIAVPALTGAAITPSAAAAILVPAASPVISAILPALQGRSEPQLQAIAAMLNHLPKDLEESRKIIQCISDSLKTAIEGRAADADLLALQPEFDEAFENWWQQWEASDRHHKAFEAELERRTGLTRAQADKFEKDSPELKAYFATLEALIEEDPIERDYPLRSDEEINRDTYKLYGLIDKILGDYYPVTKEGLALQCSAIIADGYDGWNDRVMQFVVSVASFLNLELPDALAARLFGWDDEEAEAEDAA